MQPTNTQPNTTQPTDLVSQMQNYLKTTGYTPPASSTPSSGDWYSQIKQNAPAPVAKPSSYDVAMGKTNPDGTPNTSKGIIPATVDKVSTDLSAGASGNPLQKGLQATSDVFGAVGQLPVLKQIGDVFGKGITAAGDQLSKLYTPEFNASLAKMSPEDYTKATQPLKDLQNLGNIANTILLAKGGQEVAPKVSEIGSNLVTKASDLTNKAIDTTGNLIDKTKTAVNAVKNTPSVIKEAISPKLTPEEKVGQIIQGKTTDIPAAQRTFATLPKDVVPAKMTSAKLSDTIQTKIDSNMKQVDTHFTNDNNPHPMSDFTQTVGKGKNAVQTNYVQEAINGLKEHYTAIKDSQGLSDIKALEEKANTTGLTSKELNSLAKEQGTEIQSYKKNGDLASSQKAQAAENVRAGLKTTARETLAKTDPNAAAEVTRLDKETSDAIHTKDLLDTQAQREATGVQKKGKVGSLEKAYNSKTGRAVRTVIKGGATFEAGKRLLTGSF